MVDSSFIKEAEGSALSLKRAIVIAIRARSCSKGLVNLFCLGQTSQSLLVILSVDVTETQHVVDHDEVLIEGLCVLGREVGEGGECKLVAPEGVAKLFDVVIELTEDALCDEVVAGWCGEQCFQHLDCLILMLERLLFRSRSTRKL